MRVTSSVFGGELWGRERGALLSSGRGAPCKPDSIARIDGAVKLRSAGSWKSPRAVDNRALGSNGSGWERAGEGFSLGSPAMSHAGNLEDVGWEDDDYGEQGKKVGLNSTYGANRLMVESLAQENSWNYPVQPGHTHMALCEYRR